MSHPGLENLFRYDIILASASPRRKELLSQTGIPFRTLVRPVDETPPTGMSPLQAVYHLCQEKARMFEEELQQDNTLIITADTMVVCGRKTLNKPQSPQEAYAMLRMLSGRWHRVITAVCLRSNTKTKVFHDTTRVCFRKLYDHEIWYYIEHYQPFDKAGAYGIQEWIGHAGITRIEGSYSNVVGLPLNRLYSELMRMAGGRGMRTER